MQSKKKIAAIQSDLSRDMTGCDTMAEWQSDRIIIREIAQVNIWSGKRKKKRPEETRKKERGQKRRNIPLPARFVWLSPRATPIAQPPTLRLNLDRLREISQIRSLDTRCPLPSEKREAQREGERHRGRRRGRGGREAKIRGAETNKAKNKDEEKMKHSYVRVFGRRYLGCFAAVVFAVIFLVCVTLYDFCNGSNDFFWCLTCINCMIKTSLKKQH